MSALAWMALGLIAGLVASKHALSLRSGIAVIAPASSAQLSVEPRSQPSARLGSRASISTAG